MTALEKQQKKISVIIPVYNAEKYIRETLDSIISDNVTFEYVKTLVESK